MATTNEEPADRPRPRWEAEPEKVEPSERLDAFYAMLRTRSYAVTPPTPPNDAWKRLVELRDEPADRRSWNKAYEAEELLSLFVVGFALIASFDALLVEAREHLDAKIVDSREKTFRAVTDKTGDDVSRRAALQALAEDLHEHWADEDERGEYYRRITRNTARFLVIFIALLVVLVIALIGIQKLPADCGAQTAAETPAAPKDGKPGDGKDAPKTDTKPTETKPAETKTAESKSPSCGTREFLFDVVLLLAVIASGLFGAGLSMLTSLNARLEAASMPALEKMFPPVNRLARSTVGAGAALVLFGMCWGEVLGGKLMPDLKVLKIHTVDTATPVLAHLLVLCILAGFSEKLVPSKLGELEK